MLVYLGRGSRFYGRSPLKVTRRNAWEFEAVLSGSIAPLLEDTPAPARSATLWIFPPGFPHGWTSPKRSAAEVAVFHYLSVPPPVPDCLPPQGYLEIPLRRTDILRLRALAERASRHLSRPAVHSLLSHEHTLLELSLLAVRATGEPTAHPASPEGLNCHHLVRQAMEWFGDHLDENPRLTDVCRALAISPAHLRRLFHRSLGCHPHEALSRLQFQRAQELMQHPELSLEDIAAATGFGSGSAFSRAFKHRLGYSPAEWRQALAPRS